MSDSQNSNAGTSEIKAKALTFSSESPVGIQLHIFKMLGKNYAIT